MDSVRAPESDRQSLQTLNEETMRIGETLCRRAIEKYYGADALERFREKEAKSRERLGAIFDDPVWADLFMRLEEKVRFEH